MNLIVVTFHRACRGSCCNDIRADTRVSVQRSDTKEELKMSHIALKCSRSIQSRKDGERMAKCVGLISVWHAGSSRHGRMRNEDKTSKLDIPQLKTGSSVRGPEVAMVVGRS